MKIRQLMDRWRAAGGKPSSRVRLTLDLPPQDAARIYALADMFPAIKPEEIVAGLLHTILDEVQEAFPYVNGPKQVGEDEFGNPVYEDIGYTPQFLALTQAHLHKLEKG